MWQKLRPGRLHSLAAILCALSMHVHAQETNSGAALRIVIIDGEEAVNNIRQRVARDPIVQVEDENNRPVSGALVTFTLPEHGAGGLFADGSRIRLVMTDSNGRAVARGLRPNKVPGKFSIRVHASDGGRRASATIAQTNVAPAAAIAGISAKAIALIAGVGAAAAAGGILASRGGGAREQPITGPPQPVPVTLNPGIGVVGRPR
jgi:hypothetical protein